ncbi:MAG: Spy/CpxP family protein refolding chaperone [Cyclobacteriaceae bacterium]
MNSKRWFYVSIVLIIINLMILAKMWMPKMQRRNGREQDRREVFMQNKLKLTDDQKDQMKALRKSHFAEVKGLEKKIFKARKRVYQKNKEQAPISEVSEELAMIGNIQSRIDSLTYVHFMELRAVCNEDQQEAFNELLADIIRKGLGGKMPPPRGNRPEGQNERPPRRP